MHNKWIEIQIEHGGVHYKIRDIRTVRFGVDDSGLTLTLETGDGWDRGLSIGESYAKVLAVLFAQYEAWK
jgi:hypothetical protein